jgi:hypothetical protein
MATRDLINPRTSFSETEFLNLINNQFSKIIANKRDFDIITRIPQNQEFSRTVGGFSEGGTLKRGDIVVSTVYFGSPSIYLFMGARFELEDPFESHLRKITYDTIFGYPNAHKIDLWSPGKRGSAYDNDTTPFIEIPVREGKDMQASLRQSFENATKYLRTIDSPEFKTLVSEFGNLVESRISTLLRQSLDITDYNRS